MILNIERMDVDGKTIDIIEQEWPSVLQAEIALMEKYRDHDTVKSFWVRETNG